MGVNQMEKGHEEQEDKRSLFEDDLRSGPVHEQMGGTLWKYQFGGGVRI